MYDPLVDVLGVIVGVTLVLLVDEGSDVTEVSM